MNQTRAGSNIAWESLALSEMASAYLARSPHWLISHPDWIMTGANRDSLAFTDYCLDFSRRIGLDYVVLGRFDKGKSGYEVAFSLFQLTRRTPLYDGRTASAGIREIGEDVGSAIHKAITGRQLSQIDPLWSSERQLQYYSESKLFFLKNDLQAAYEKARNALKLDSTSTICLNYLAEIEVQSARQQMTDGEVPIARFSRANSLLRASADIDKDNPNTYLHFAQLYVLNKRWGLAEESLKHSLDLNPLNSKLYTLLAQLHPDRYKDLGFSSDREVLARALFINPCDFDARLTLADIYRTVNKPDRAVAILKEGLRINPNKMSVLMALANAYTAQNDLLNSLELYKRILSLNPDQADAYYNLGILYYHQKDYDQAIQFFQHAINLVDHPDSHLYLAHIYEKRGEIKSAITELKRRVALSRGTEDRYAEQAREELARLLSPRREKKVIIKKTSVPD